MSEGLGTNPSAEESGGSARSRRRNSNSYTQERPANTVPGLEHLMLIPGSRSPALDLKKAKEAIQGKIQSEQRHGYEAAALLNGGLTQTSSTSVGLSQQGVRPTPPTMPDQTSDEFELNGTFSTMLYEAALAQYK